MARLSDPTRLLIAFYSRTGSVETLAKAAEEGARSHGATVRLRRAREVVDDATIAKSAGWLDSATRQNALYDEPTTEDAEWADAILMATELKAYFDQLGPQWKNGALAGKVGGCLCHGVMAAWRDRGRDLVALAV